jgi:hypothetical protein
MSLPSKIFEWWQRRQTEAERIEAGLWRPAPPQYQIVGQPLYPDPPPPPPPYIPEEEEDYMPPISSKPPLANNSDYLRDGYADEQKD